MTVEGGDNGRVYYERRYAEGYMDDWSAESKGRVREILQSMNLREEGDALDFGCGTGVFTQVIKETLPKWNVYGADISRTAILAATERYGDCRFHALDDPELAGKTFDLVFSNHVLEHVHDLPKELRRIDGLAAAGASVLHVLPCGNEGSFEHSICLLVKNGIDAARGYRYFFEDDGHVRRLDADGMKILTAADGMALVQEFYANQYYGAILWITADPRNVGKIFDPGKAIDVTSAAKLRRYRTVFLILSLVRLPSVIVTRFLRKTWNMRFRHYLLFAVALPFYPFSCWFDLYLARQAAREWRERKTHRNGSEMFLHFRKIAAE